MSNQNDSSGQSVNLGLWTVVYLIVVPTFGFGNITTNIVSLGQSSIPSWFIVAVFFFLPLSLMIAELSSVRGAGSSGVYTWIRVGLGEKWAFVGTWSYFIANLFYLQMVYARFPILVSWALYGENRFTDASAYWIPYLSVVICIVLTWIATTGVKCFSKLNDIGGKMVLVVTAAFLIFAIVGLFIGHAPATDFTVEELTPAFDTSYFSTFSWLLFSVAGAEVGGTYVKNMKNPKRDFPKAVLISTAMIGVAYVVGSLAVLLVATPDVIAVAGVKDAQYVVYKMLADSYGLNGKLVVQLFATINGISWITCYVIWMESPIRAIFSEVPEGTFPPALTKQEPDGTLKNALWLQCAVVVFLIIIPLFGMEGLDHFFNMVTNLSALSGIPAYAILSISYFVYRLKKNRPMTDYSPFRSNATALPVAGAAILLAVLGYFGAGLDYFIWAETRKEAVIQMISTYGGPIILIIVGVIMCHFSRRHYNKKKTAVR